MEKLSMKEYEMVEECVCASRRAGPTDWHGQQLKLRQSSDFDLCTILVASEFDSNQLKQ